jgi:glyoxylate carboligase
VSHHLSGDATPAVARPWKDTRANNRGWGAAFSVADHDVDGVRTVGHSGSANGQFVELLMARAAPTCTGGAPLGSGVPAGISGADLDADSR